MVMPSYVNLDTTSISELISLNLDSSLVYKVNMSDAELNSVISSSPCAGCGKKCVFDDGRVNNSCISCPRLPSAIFEKLTTTYVRKVTNDVKKITSSELSLYTLLHFYEPNRMGDIFNIPFRDIKELTGFCSLTIKSALLKLANKGYISFLFEKDPSDYSRSDWSYLNVRISHFRDKYLPKSKYGTGYFEFSFDTWKELVGKSVVYSKLFFMEKLSHFYRFDGNLNKDTFQLSKDEVMKSFSAGYKNKFKFLAKKLTDTSEGALDVRTTANTLYVRTSEKMMFNSRELHSIASDAVKRLGSYINSRVDTVTKKKPGYKVGKIDTSGIPSDVVDLLDLNTIYPAANYNLTLSDKDIKDIAHVAVTFGLNTALKAMVTVFNVHFNKFFKTDREIGELVRTECRLPYLYGLDTASART